MRRRHHQKMRHSAGISFFHHFHHIYARGGVRYTDRFPALVIFSVAHLLYTGPVTVCTTMVLRHLLFLLSTSSTSLTCCWAVGTLAARGGSVGVGALGGKNHHRPRQHYRRRQLQSSSNTTSTMLSVNELCGKENAIAAIEQYSTSAFLTFFGNISINVVTESGGFNCGCLYDDDYNGQVSLMNSLRVVCSLVYTSPASSDGGEDDNNATNTNATTTPSIVSTNREFLILASTVILLPEPDDDEDEDPEQDENNSTTTTAVERYIPTRSGWADSTGLVSWSETFDFDYVAAIEDASILQFDSCDVDNGYCNEGQSECFVCEPGGEDGENNNSTQTTIRTTVSISSACQEFGASCDAGYRGSYMNEYFLDNNIVAVLADERFACGDDVDDTVPTRDEFCANLGDMETTLYDAFTVYANNTPPNEDFSCSCSTNNNEENEDENDDPTVGLGFTVTCGTTWTTTDPDDAEEEIELGYTEIMTFVLRGAYLVPEQMSWCNMPPNTQQPVCTDYQFCVGQESLCSCSRVGCDTDYCELCSDGASVGYKCPSDPEPVLCSANVVGAFSFAFRDLQIAPNCTSAPGVPSISPTVSGLPTSAPTLVSVSSETSSAPTMTNGSSLVSNAPTPTLTSNSSDMPSASPVVPTDDETTVAPVAAPVGPPDSSSSSSPTLTPDGSAVIPPTSGVSAAGNGMLLTAFFMSMGVTMAMLL
jgi:hypothetical protein